VRQRIVRAFLIEEQKIVKQVLRQSTAAPAKAAKAPAKATKSKQKK
jgi:hypothetical protein